MTATEVLKQLEKLGTAQTRKTWLRHGAREPLFGVKVGDMKPLVKKIKRDTALAWELYKTGNADAQYFAGLIADGRDLSTAELEQWAEKASWHMVSEYTVAWLAAENPRGWDLALGWIDSGVDHVSAGGWSTLGSIVSTRPDAELDLKAIEKLLKRVVKHIHRAPNRTRYTMNGFVISVGAAVAPLAAVAVATAHAIGVVSVDVGETECKVPSAAYYIEKCVARSGTGKKRKTVKC